MKAVRALVVGFLSIAAAQSVLAADMPVKARPIAAAAPVSTWTGLYLGGAVGVYWRDQDGSTSATPSPGFGAPAITGAGIAGYGVLPTVHSLDRSGILGSLYGGYNWQFGKALVGIEGDYTFLDAKNATVSQPVNA